jgi:hypothetical protein
MKSETKASTNTRAYQVKTQSQLSRGFKHFEKEEKTEAHVGKYFIFSFQLFIFETSGFKGKKSFDMRLRCHYAKKFKFKIAEGLLATRFSLFDVEAERTRSYYYFCYTHQKVFCSVTSVSG